MATQNSTITVKGKLGNIVGYKGRDGKRLARIRQSEVKNPKTDGQVIQRMIIATSAKAYSLMKSIVDHSFEGVQYGGASQSFFLKKAAEDIRAYVAKNYPDFVETDQLALVGLATPNSFGYAGVGLMISKGNLSTIPCEVSQDGQSLLFGKVMTGSTVQDVLTSVNARPGDQITFCGIDPRGNWFESRYIVKADATAAQLAKAWDATGAADYFDAQTLVTQQLLVENNHLGNAANVSTGAVILSRKDGSVWKRSTQRLYTVDVAIDSWVTDEDDPAHIIPMWKEGTTPIESTNPYYLNQAEQAGE